MKFCIIVVMAASALALLSCNKEGGFIPRGTLSEIYAEMFMADEWLGQDYKRTRGADSLIVYEPIFNKYGYTAEDYRRTVDHYMDNPESFALVFDKTAEILQARLDVLEADEKVKYRTDSLMRVYRDRKYPVMTSFPDELEKSYLIERLTLDRKERRDGSIGPMSFGVLVPAVPDTLFKGPELIISEPEGKDAAVALADSARVRRGRPVNADAAVPLGRKPARPEARDRDGAAHGRAFGTVSRGK